VLFLIIFAIRSFNVSSDYHGVISFINFLLMIYYLRLMHAEVAEI